jgi:hypothetical protein
MLLVRTGQGNGCRAVPESLFFLHFTGAPYSPFAASFCREGIVADTFTQRGTGAARGDGSLQREICRRDARWEKGTRMWVPFAVSYGNVAFNIPTVGMELKQFLSLKGDDEWKPSWQDNCKG